MVLKIAIINHFLWLSLSITTVISNDKSYKINDNLESEMLNNYNQNHYLVFTDTTGSRRHRICIINGEEEDDLTLTLQNVWSTMCNDDDEHITLGRSVHHCDRTLSSLNITFKTKQFKIEIYRRSSIFQIEVIVASDKKLHCYAGTQDFYTEKDENNNIIIYIVIPSCMFVFFLLVAVYSCYRFMHSKSRPEPMPQNEYNPPENNRDTHHYDKPSTNCHLPTDYLDVI
ncbi:uncharacterized protein LOC106077559 isoform X1 [Biomphalaria glabrata]|uniref:Uncharacterized protein LOC106077559 isoform X1 n=2 Tax=Biomphalaria glabrata TaxID=6526 RepID=A0A9W3AMP4_BIOGL|nr:uncharacterized protein LOC106077559 isoform X1 [Biomphalaria glabrata]XP_055888533.1 uncharacterized protein LOC106077559 isoform X1 [Biomphalaria glabrata]